MMDQEIYVLSIDQSTQGTKAMLFDSGGKIVGKADKSHQQIINDKGWVEHDLEEIAENVLYVVRQVVNDSGIDKADIKAVGVTNQRETVGLWNRNTGVPVGRAIVWQCNRASGICDQISDEDADYLFNSTGLKLSPFFSAPKIAWMLENTPDARSQAEKGDLCCGTMDCWVIFSLTKGKSHKTDLSNATRMQLVNLVTCDWDQKACQIYDLPMSILPTICDSDAYFGETDFDGFLDNPIPIHSAIGDSNGAMYAQGCHNRGDCMTGYGTGSSVMINIGDSVILSDQGSVTSVAWRTDGQTNYMLSGVINYSGAVITWLIESLGLVKTPQETDKVASSAKPGDRTYLVPAFTGIGAPYWSNRANAVFSGMTRLTGRSELVRATLESIAYQIADVIFSISETSGVSVSEMRVSGGPTKNTYLMQFQSDIIGCKILVPSNQEMSLQGAAYIAGIASGVIDSSVLQSHENAQVFIPSMNEKRREELLTGWQAAVRAAIEM